MNILSKQARRGAPFLAGMLLLTVFTGCMQTFGRFSKDDQVREAFRNGTVPAELNYFYTGRETMPYAIMGIDPSYAVPSAFWIAFDPQPERLRDISSNLYGRDRYDPYGFNIVAPDGAFVGIWFSNLNFASVVVNQENRTVDVRYKNPESYADE